MLNKEDWLQICKLNHEWYLRSTIEGATDETIKKFMPKDEVFDDGRFEFFEKNFKPSNKSKLEQFKNFWRDAMVVVEDYPVFFKMPVSEQYRDRRINGIIELYKKVFNKKHLEKLGIVNIRHE